MTSERGWRGGERQLLLLADGLAGHGVTQLVAAPPGSEVARRGRAAGLDVLELPSPVHLHPVALARLLRAVIAWRPTLLHSHTSKALDAVRLVRRLCPGCRIVHTRRVTYPLRRSRKHRTAADLYVAVAEAVAAQLVAGGAPPERVRVIPSGVDLAAVDAPGFEADPLPGEAGPIVVCVGALVPEKGHAILLEAWREVVSARPDARLVLLGDGPERGRVESAAAGLPAGAVCIAGHRDDVPAWLRRARVLVLPSLVEGIGGAALEAMACRLPVVASRVGGLPEAIEDGRTGALVPPGRPAELAAALLALLADPELARRMGEAGRSRVEARFSAGETTRRYLAAYRDLLSPR